MELLSWYATALFNYVQSEMYSQISGQVSLLHRLHIAYLLNFADL